MGFKSGGQQRGDGGEQGAAVAGADPAAQLEMLGADQGRRLDRLQDIPGLRDVGHGHQIHDQTLEHPPPEWDPDELAGLHGEPGRDGVGEGPRMAHRRVHRNLRVSHAKL